MTVKAPNASIDNLLVNHDGPCDQEGPQRVILLVPTGDASGLVANVTVTNVAQTVVGIIGYDAESARPQDGIALINNAAINVTYTTIATSTPIVVAIVHATGNITLTCNGLETCMTLTQQTSPTERLVIEQSNNVVELNVTALTNVFGAALERQFYHRKASLKWSKVILASVLALSAGGLVFLGVYHQAPQYHSHGSNES